MVNLFIFILGLLVSALVGTAYFLVGLHEASNEVASDPEDLTEWEKELVDRDDIDDTSEAKSSS